MSGLFLCISICITPAAGQQLRRVDPSLTLRQAVDGGNTCSFNRCPAAAQYDVVALRLEFQPDTTRYTSGDGTFEGNLFDGLLPNVDPLPHDADYFEAHLSFLSDYVARVSDGRTRVRTHLIPEIIRVSQRMEVYSPVGHEAGSDTELVKLASLIEEAWTLADAESVFDLSGFDPDKTVFILFHAGVGRDVELIGTTLDKTPQDLPSLFFDPSTLRRLLGPESISFKGFLVDHTLILPRTETRRAYDFIQDQAFLLELSINGMLAASFFNYLNVPDLFDTSSGESAIGPFGLMDPLGIFAYNGLFPPEPTAWTKQFLGWGDELVLSGDGPEEVVLQAAGLVGRSEAAIVPVSDAEYFLVENRHRDPEGDGLVMQVWKDGQIEEQRVANGTTDFNERNIDGFIGGVVVGVDNYDWALPGGLSEDGDELNGGILIWHVDERILAESYGTNSVNADRHRRAIDLEEADGAQDIGFPSGSIFGPQPHLGSPFDFYYEGNPITVITQIGESIRLYENRFGPDTYPDSRNNEGGISGIVLEDFSLPGTIARFVYRRGQMGGLSLLPEFDFQLSAGGTGNGVFARGGSILPFGENQKMLAVYGDGTYFIVDGATGTVLHVNEGDVTQPVAVSDSEVEVFSKDVSDVLTIYRYDAEGSSEIVQSLHVPADYDYVRLYSPPVVTNDGSRYVIYRGINDERSGVFRIVSGTVDVVAGVEAVGTPVSLSVIDEQNLAVVGTQGVSVVGTDVSWTYSFTDGTDFGQGIFGTDETGLVGVVPVLDEDAFLFLLADGTVRRIDVAGKMTVNERQMKMDPVFNPYPVLVDLDLDGRLDVLVTFDTYLIAFTQGGAFVSGFPLILSTHSVAQPLVSELTGSGFWSVLVTGFNGYLYAYDLGRDGEPVAGFPAAAGSEIQATPLLSDEGLYAVTVDGFMRGYAFESIGNIWWGRLFGNGNNHSYTGHTTSGSPAPDPGRLLVQDETYNWPNPILDGWTYLRFQTQTRATVEVSVIDAAGALCDEFVFENIQAGVPTEYLWQTDAASGLYFARIRAVGENGQSDTKLVKMAIIR